MKKILSALLGIAAAALLIVSCDGMVSPGQITKPGEKPLSKLAEVTVNVESMAVSRTIFPGQWNDTTANTLKYVLTGSKTSGDDTNAVPANEFTYSQIKTSNAKVRLEPAVWYLTLTAYTDSEHELVSLVSEEVEVDLTNGNADADFDLKAVYVTNATGKANITVKFTKPSNFDRVVYGIYEGAAVDSEYVGAGVTANPAELTKVTDDLTTVNAEGQVYSVNYTNAAIKAGKNYHFNVKFYDSNNRVILFYTEGLVIDAGNTSTSTITLDLDLFNVPPKNPQALAVAYAFNDSSAMVPQEIADGEELITNYEATFTWDDNSNNETGFELVLKDLATNVETTYNKESSVEAGSLAASSTTVTIKLATGKEYSAKIRAVNGFTATEAVYTDLTPTVNLYTVTYELKSGSVKLNAEGASTAAGILKYAVPYNKTETAIPLLTASTASYPYVYRENYSFLKWYTPTDELVTEVAADNTENIELTAYWESNVGIKITMPDYSSVDDYALVTDYADSIVKTISGVKTGDDPVVVTLTPNANLSNVTWAIYTTEGTAVDASTYSVDADTKVLSWTITADAADPAPAIEVAAGVYRVYVTAEYKGYNVDGSAYIKITR